MKKISVELLSYTPEEVLLKAVSMPYKNEKSSLKLAEKVCKVLKHESVSEHVYMSFLVKGISRLELQEHMRHRISSTTCESTRFTIPKIVQDDSSVDNYVFPEYVEEDWKLQNGLSPEENYREYCEGLTHIFKEANSTVRKFINKGYGNDYIKYCLPEAYRTQFVWTLNIRTLNNFLALRDSKTAHFEIRKVAQLLREQVEKTYISCLLYDKK